MSDATTNIMAQAGFAVHGMRRGFIVVIVDTKHGDYESFNV
mgnify:CR=1 FL=1